MPIIQGLWQLVLVSSCFDQWIPTSIDMRRYWVRRSHSHKWCPPSLVVAQYSRSTTDPRGCFHRCHLYGHRQRRQLWPINCGVDLFSLEYAGEFCVIAIRRKRGGSDTSSTSPLDQGSGYGKKQRQLLTKDRKWRPDQLGLRHFGTPYRLTKNSEVLSTSQTPKLELIPSSSKQGVKARVSTIKNTRVSKLPQHSSPENDKRSWDC
jgi:hypothetical protein